MNENQNDLIINLPRMWGGTVSLEKIEAGLKVIKGD